MSAIGSIPPHADVENNDLSQQVEITIQCANLVKADMTSKSDPFVVFYEWKMIRDGDYKGEWLWTEINRSEVIQNDHDPQFAKRFQLEYRFEEEQKMMVVVYDFDGKLLPKHKGIVPRDEHIVKRNQFLVDKGLVSGHDKHRKSQEIGQAEFVLGDVVSACGQTRTVKLSGKKIKHKKDKDTPTATLTCEEVAQEKWTCDFTFAASNLPKMDGWLGKADPYYIIKRELGGKWQTIRTSEIIKKHLNPTWAPFQISSYDLCNSDLQRNIKIEVYDWDKNSNDDLIGTVVLKAEDLCKKGAHELAKQGKKSGSRGTFVVESAKITRNHSFLEYLQGGTQISLMIAIDYTGSNGDPSNPKSLHYYDPMNPNQYVQAISQVGNVLAPYDTDHKFPVWIFGARHRQTREKLFCQPLSKLVDPNAGEEVHGINSLIHYYGESFKKVTLSGPTNFTPFLEKAAEEASTQWSDDEQTYHILLVLTDGAISDMQKTRSQLIKCSRLPMSVVIVGVGNMSDSAVASMDELDADKQDGGSSLSDGTDSAERDLVQFVQFREEAKRGNVSSATLKELPKQFLDYMQKNNIKPLDPKKRVAREEQRLKQMQMSYGQPMGSFAPGMAGPGMGMMNIQQQFGQMNIQPEQMTYGQSAPQYGGQSMGMANPQYSSASAPAYDDSSSLSPPSYNK